MPPACDGEQRDPTPMTGDGPPFPEHGWLIADDCLPAMRTTLAHLAGQVDLVLTDPPYNTGRRFTYRDDFGGAEAWLDFVAPRLAAARDLLAPDGALVVHIDEHQHHRLRGFLDRLFGESNLLGEIVWDKLNPKGDAGQVAAQHETLLTYARDRGAFRERRRPSRAKPNAGRMLGKARELFARVGSDPVPQDLLGVIDRYALDIDPEAYRRRYTLEDARAEFREWVEAQPFGGGERAYRHLDVDGRVYRTVSMAWPNKRSPPPDYFVPLVHPVTGRPCPVPLRGWRNPSKTMRRLLDEGRIVFGPDEHKQPERKYFLDEHLRENLPSVIRYGGSDDALLRSLGVPFDHPKPVALTTILIEAFTAGGGVVLDPFAGSGTVGHACLELAAGGSDYRFVAIQSPEPLDANVAWQRDAAELCRAAGRPSHIAGLMDERIGRCAARLRQATGFEAILRGLASDQMGRSSS